MQSPQNVAAELRIHSLACWDWCFTLPQLLYRWWHQSGIFWIPPHIYLKFIKQTEMRHNFINCNECLNVYVSEWKCFVTASLREVEKAADHINSLVQDHENMQRMLQLQNCLCGGKPRIVMPGRRLLKEGTLLKVSVLSGLIHY
jgi:hypothetical protein